MTTPGQFEVFGPPSIAAPELGLDPSMLCIRIRIGYWSQDNSLALFLSEWLRVMVAGIRRARPSHVNTLRTFYQDVCGPTASW